MTGDPQLDLARAGFDAVQGDPAAAQAQLDAVLADAESGLRARMVARWGLGRLLHNAGAYGRALAHFDAAVELAEELGDEAGAAEVRISAAVTHQTRGDVPRALAELELAAPFVRGPTAGRHAGQRALVLLNLGRPLDALADFARAIPFLRSTGDHVGLARTYVNRAVAHLQLRAMAAARADLVRAHELASTVGEHLVAAGALHNLGCVDGRLGHHPAALRAFEEARTTYVRLGNPGRLLATLDVDHCEVLLEVGLAREALEIADRLVAEFDASGDLMQLGEARLLRTKALHLLGDHDGAVAEAARAEQLLAAHDRESWAAYAAYLGLRAASRSPGRAAEVDIGRLDELARRFDGHGWRAEAAEVRTIYGRLAIERGDLNEARRQLRLASRAGRGASVDVRAQAHLARALIGLADGDDATALAAALRGIAVVERRRASFGSSELRMASSAVAVPLVGIGLQIALRSNRPGAVLRWAERGRAASMDRPSVQPPSDPELAADLAELRELHQSHGDPAVDDRVAEVERRILRRRRLDLGGHAAPRHASAADLRTQLRGDVLVELVAEGGRLHAVVVRSRRSELVELGDVHELRAESEHLLFALRRLAIARRDDPRQASVIASLELAAEQLDRMLFAPLRLPGASGLVLVPTGDLHVVPWSALPTVRGRPTTLTPSASRWWRGAPRPPQAGSATRPTRPRVALVAGPDLEHSAAELAELASLHGNAVVASGAAATVARVLEVLEAADIAHIAAHGQFRADSPMFSALRLHDGPMCVHDLEGLRSLPTVVVLTACDAGRSAVLAGDELMGTAASLLGLGVGTVVAPVLPVPDDAAAAFAVALHRRLAAGESPAAALASVSAAAWASGDPAAVAVASSFQCIGTRDSRVGGAPVPARRPPRRALVSA